MNIQELRNIEPRIISIGNHPGIIQSILDYDFLIGRTTPSIVGIIANGKQYARFFMGNKELLIPVYNSLDIFPKEQKEKVKLRKLAYDASCPKRQRGPTCNKNAKLACC